MGGRNRLSLPPLQKYCRGPRRDREGTGGSVVPRSSGNRIRERLLQDGVQSQTNAGVVRYADCLRDLINIEKHDDALGVRVELTTDLVRNRHDNQRRLLSRTYVVEFHPLFDLVSSLEPEQRARLADSEDIFEIEMGRVDRREPGFQSWVNQEGIHSRPIAFVILLLRQSNREIVRLVRPIEPVEPVP